jgi:hypothetical protein
MKIALNKCYGDFHLSAAAHEILDPIFPDADWLDDEWLRTSPALVDLIVEKGTEWVSAPYSKIVVKVLPDEITDFTIMSYDGMEVCVFCVDGKIHLA